MILSRIALIVSLSFALLSCNQPETTSDSASPLDSNLVDQEGSHVLEDAANHAKYSIPPNRSPFDKSLYFDQPESDVPLNPKGAVKYVESLYLATYTRAKREDSATLWNRMSDRLTYEILHAGFMDADPFIAGQDLPYKWTEKFSYNLSEDKSEVIVSAREDDEEYEVVRLELVTDGDSWRISKISNLPFIHMDALKAQNLPVEDHITIIEIFDDGFFNYQFTHFFKHGDISRFIIDRNLSEFMYVEDSVTIIDAPNGYITWQTDSEYIDGSVEWIEAVVDFEGNVYRGDNLGEVIDSLQSHDYGSNLWRVDPIIRGPWVLYQEFVP